MQAKPRPTTPSNPLVASLVQRLSPDLREDYEERAAIMEFDAVLSRDLAEALALLDVIQRHPDAIVGLSLLRVIERGKVRYVITCSEVTTIKAMQSRGCAVSGSLPLKPTLQHEFNGWAWLCAE